MSKTGSNWAMQWKRAYLTSCDQKNSLSFKYSFFRSYLRQRKNSVSYFTWKRKLFLSSHFFKTCILLGSIFHNSSICFCNKKFGSLRWNYFKGCLSWSQTLLSESKDWEKESKYLFLSSLNKISLKFSWKVKEIPSSIFNNFVS